MGSPVFNSKFRVMVEGYAEHMRHRRCLKCGKTFLSWSKGNRICYECNEENRKLGVSAYSNPMHGLQTMNRVRKSK